MSPNAILFVEIIHGYTSCICQPVGGRGLGNPECNYLLLHIQAPADRAIDLAHVKYRGPGTWALCIKISAVRRNLSFLGCSNFTINMNAPLLKQLKNPGKNWHIFKCSNVLIILPVEPQCQWKSMSIMSPSLDISIYCKLSILLFFFFLSACVYTQATVRLQRRCDNNAPCQHIQVRYAGLGLDLCARNELSLT